MTRKMMTVLCTAPHVCKHPWALGLGCVSQPRNNMSYNATLVIAGATQNSMIRRQDAAPFVTCVTCTSNDTRCLVRYRRVRLWFAATRHGNQQPSGNNLKVVVRARPIIHTAGTVNSSAAIYWSLAFLYGGRVSLAYSNLQWIWRRCRRNPPKN